MRVRKSAADTEAVDVATLVSHLPDVIYRIRLWPSFGVDYISDAVVRQTGYTPEELAADARLLFLIVHPDDRPLLEERIGTGPTPSSVIIRWQRRDGRLIWVEHRETPVHDRSGKLIAIEGIGHEISDPTGTPGSTIRVLGGVRIDLRDRTVRVDGRPVHLSPAEYRLLICLTDTPGKVRTPDELMRYLWRSSHAGRGHTCANCISALRKKIERDSRFPERILTVRSHGYKYAAD